MSKNDFEKNSKLDKKKKKKKINLMTFMYSRCRTRKNDTFDLKSNYLKSNKIDCYKISMSNCKKVKSMKHCKKYHVILYNRVRRQKMTWRHVFFFVVQTCFSKCQFVFSFDFVFWQQCAHFVTIFFRISLFDVNVKNACCFIIHFRKYESDDIKSINSKWWWNVKKKKFQT